MNYIAKAMQVSQSRAIIHIHRSGINVTFMFVCPHPHSYFKIISMLMIVVLFSRFQKKYLLSSFGQSGVLKSFILFVIFILQDDKQGDHELFCIFRMISSGVSLFIFKVVSSSRCSQFSFVRISSLGKIMIFIIVLLILFSCSLLTLRSSL